MFKLIKERFFTTLTLSTTEFLSLNFHCAFLLWNAAKDVFAVTKLKMTTDLSSLELSPEVKCRPDIAVDPPTIQMKRTLFQIQLKITLFTNELDFQSHHVSIYQSTDNLFHYLHNVVFLNFFSLRETLNCKKIC